MKFNNGNTRTMWEIFLKLTIKTLKRHQWQGSATKKLITGQNIPFKKTPNVIQHLI